MVLVPAAGGQSLLLLLLPSQRWLRLLLPALLSRFLRMSRWVG